VVAYVAALIPALLMALTQPVWSLVDEADHYDFIVQLGHGVYPVADRTPITPETMSISESTGVFKAFYPPGTYPAPDLSDVAPPPDGMSADANAGWMLRHMWQLSRESIQTPLYYLLMVPFWAASDHVGGPLFAVYVLRVINALLIASLAPLAVVAARIVAPGRSEIAALSAMLAILLPGLALNGTRVSNDSLAAVLGGVLVVALLSWTGLRWSWRRAAAVGALLGACIMVKLTLGMLVLAVALAMLWPVRSQSLMERATRLALASAVAVLAAAPWLVVNLRLYGAPMPGPHLLRLSEVVPGGLTAPFIPLDIAVFHLSYWSGEPWGILPLSGPFAALGGLIVLAVPVGLYRLGRARAILGPVAVAATSVAVTVLTALALPATAGYEFEAPGRYAYAALPAAAVLSAIGLVAVLGSRAVIQTVAAVYVLLASTMLILGAAGVPRTPAPPPSAPPADAQFLAASATGERGDLTIRIDRIANQRNPDGRWFHIIASNHGAQEVEWTVPDYSASSGLPVDIDPGQSASGWIYVPGAQTYQLRFTGVTTDGYTSVGDIVVTISRPAYPG
jgi:hypothetical protein